MERIFNMVLRHVSGAHMYWKKILWFFFGKMQLFMTGIYKYEAKTQKLAILRTKVIW